MDVLPPVTEPPREPARRLHSPRRAEYAEYRRCLRWEFGFTCAFCLLHEADLTTHGVEGTGLTWIEHREPRSAAPDSANEYRNCIYACRDCNRSRDTVPTAAPDGSRLLDPCRDAWGAHFHPDDDCLVPEAGDADAAYTHRACRIDDERKQRMRRERREGLAAAVRRFEAGTGLVPYLLDLAARVEEAERASVLACVQDLRDAATRTLRRYAAVPHDAPASCRCGDAVPRRLPAWLAAQTVPAAPR